MKRVFLALAILVVVAIGVLFWATNQVDGVVAAEIERTASELLGTDVTVSGVNVDLAAGSVLVAGIRVANPKGERLAFSTEPAFELGAITVVLDLDRLDVADPLAAPLPLRVVEVTAPVANAELTPGGLNLEILRRNVAASGSSTTSAPDVRLDIAEFHFAQGRVIAETSDVGGERRELPLPPLTLRNLRGTPDEIGRRLADAFLGAAIRQVARDELSTRVDERLDEVKEKAVGALRSLLGVEDDPAN